LGRNVALVSPIGGLAWASGGGTVLTSAHSVAVLVLALAVVPVLVMAAAQV
jgi:uncharacterized membrane protein